MFCQFLRFILLLILGCVSDSLISVSWSSQIESQDEFSTQQDRLSSLPADVMPLIFEPLDDKTLSCITRVSKKYKQFEHLTELIFQKRSDFKEVLPLVFSEGNPWKHSYFLRKGFWKFLLDYKSTFYQNISEEEGAKLKRFNNYCVTYKFMASDLIFFILKTLSYDFKYSLLQEPETKDCLLNSDVNLFNHLAKFNQNLSHAVLNQEVVGLEVGTIMGALEISISEINEEFKDDFDIELKPLKDSFFLQCYQTLYQKSSNLFRSIIQKSTSDDAKTTFICDVVQAGCKDYKKALKRYQDVVNYNCSIAKNKIGMMYAYGQGVKQDYTKAMSWFLGAAMQENKYTQCNVGIMYKCGEGVEQNYAEALIWYRKAADQGNTNAQNYIGDMYVYGHGVTQDYIQALEWYQKAADQQNILAKLNLGCLYKLPKICFQDTEKAEIILESLRQSLTCKISELSNLEHNILGMIYTQGLESHRDLDKAFEHFKQANEYNSFIQVYLGRLYKEGQGTAQDFSQALAWIQESSDGTNFWGQYNLALMYLNGEGVTQNDQEALTLFHLSADQGEDNAQYFLGWMYEQGRGTNVDLEISKFWYQKTAKRHPHDALYSLGRSYEYGLGVEKDKSKAIDYYHQSDELGDLNAKERLKFLN